MSNVPFVRYDPSSGEIIGWGAVPEGDLPLQPGSILRGVGRPETGYVSGGAIVAYTPAQQATKRARARNARTWSNTTMSWSATG